MNWKTLLALLVLTTLTPLAAAAPNMDIAWNTDGFPQETTVDYGETAPFIVEVRGNAEATQRDLTLNLFRNNNGQITFIKELDQTSYVGEGTIYEYDGQVTPQDYTQGGTYEVRAIAEEDNSPTTVGLTLNVDQDQLNIEYIDCVDPVVQEAQQRCNTQITSNGEPVQDANLALQYSTGNSIASCQTNTDGYCAVQFNAPQQPGTYTVQGTATKQGFAPDNDGQPTDTFQVLTEGYTIENLQTYNDTFQTATDTFFRNNKVWLDFQVRSQQTGELIPVDSNIFTSAELRVYQQTNAKNLGDLLNTYPLTTEDLSKQDGTNFQYVLPRIPITDDYLGEGTVFVLAINYTNNEAGQATKEVTILNNPLEFTQPSDRQIIQGQTQRINLEPNVADIETPLSEIQSELTNLGPYTAQRVNNLAYDVTAPNTATQQTVTVTADDTDGSTATQTFTITTPSIEDPNQAPQASFTFTPTNPEVGETVTFTSTSTDTDGTITETQWNIDGQIFTGEEVSTAFNEPGTYTATLTVTDNDGATDTATQTIEVTEQEGQRPTASFTFTPANPETGEEVTFTSTSTDPNNDIVAYEWFVDGVQFGAQETATYTFDAPGTYTIRHEVIDSEGRRDTATQQITITQGNRAPQASFTYTPRNPEVGQEVTFTATSTDPDGDALSHAWDLDGDGNIDRTGDTVTFTYNFPGTFAAFLVSTDTEGASDTARQSISVAQGNQAPTASFTFTPETPEVGEQTTFTSTSTDSDGDIVAYEWLVNGERFGTMQQAQRTFQTPGTYSVTLEVQDNDGATDTATQQVTVSEEPNEQPSASFTFTPNNPEVDETVLFNATSSFDPDGTITEYTWSVNGQPTTELQGPLTDIRFGEPGTYNVGLTVTDNEGATATAQRTLTVTQTPNQPPTADYTFTPQSPEPNQTVTFTSQATDQDGEITLRQWFFPGQPLPATGETVTNVFKQPGTYSVTHRVQDNRGAVTEVTKNVTVQVQGEAPNAALRAPTRVDIGQTVTLNASRSTDADGTITQYAWTVTRGDATILNTTTTEPTITYQPSAQGLYEATVTVTDNDGLTDTAQATTSSEKTEDTTPRPDTEVSMGTFSIYSDQGFAVLQNEEPFVLTAQVSNDGPRTAENLRLKFTIPEIGYERTGTAFNERSDDGSSKSLRSVLYNVPPGDYFAYVSVNGGNVHRQNVIPITVTE